MRTVSSFGHYLIDNCELLVVIAVLSAWQWLTGTTLSWRVGVTVVLFPQVPRVVEALRTRYRDGVANVPKKRERVFLRDPEAVLRLDQLSGLEYHKTIGPNIDKWITVTGMFEGSAESLLRDSLHLSLLREDGRRVNVQFAKEHAERIRELRPGQRITLVCQICLGNGLALRNAELVSAEPLRRAS